VIDGLSRRREARPRPCGQWFLRKNYRDFHEKKLGMGGGRKSAGTAMSLKGRTKVGGC